MKLLQGKYTNAVIYADIVDNKTIEQLLLLLDQEFMKDLDVKIMADCHQGTGCVIGTTIKISDKIVPNLVGVDIGCGMLTIKLGKTKIDFQSLDKFIHKSIPAGMKVNETISPYEFDLEQLKCYKKLKRLTYLKKSLGTLGGGNHFIEVDKNEFDEYYLIIHSGSRNLGNQVAHYYQDKAIRYQESKLFNKEAEIKKTIKEFKEQGRQKEIENEIKKIKNMNIELSMPKELCYLEGQDFVDYLHDMDICQKFAAKNREEIAKRILSFLNLDLNKLEYFETIHNYINMKDKILRKGAISAYKEELVLIPINMRDGCIIAKGKDNAAYNYSAPHGAGRTMSRSKAIETIKLKDFVDSMAGIYSTTINKSTIDESPFAYKPIQSIIDNIKETVEILEIIKPVYNFKASE